MAKSVTKPMQFKDALPSTCKSLEEKGTGSRGRTKVGPRGEKERCSNAYGLRGGGRRETTTGMQEEDISHVPIAFGVGYADR
jgi:hypothetical protein